MGTKPRVWRWGEPVEILQETVRRGGILAIPTESTYGLGVDPRSSSGVEAVFRVKGREPGKPLPVVAAHLEQLVELGVDLGVPYLDRLAAAWPGPLSVILPLRAPLPAAGGGKTLAVRIPGHARLRALLAAVGTALTATSANRSGEEAVVTPGLAEDLLAGFDAVVIDDGQLPGGPPSTLVEIGENGWRVLREGRYPREALAELLGEKAGRDRRAEGNRW